MTQSNGASCAGQPQYSTRQQAERAAAPRRAGGQNVRAVPCTKCRHWHVGEGRQ